MYSELSFLRRQYMTTLLCILGILFIAGLIYSIILGIKIMKEIAVLGNKATTGMMQLSNPDYNEIIKELNHKSLRNSN
jgi:hypothetical protein